MNPPSLVDALSRIVFGGVAMTAEALDQATGGQELTFTQWRAILFTGETDDGRRVGEVARQLMAGLSATSRLLRRLEDRGFVSLERDEHDRRATRARLTEKGQALRESVLAWRRDQIAGLVDDLEIGPEAAAALVGIAARFEARGRAVGVQRVGRRPTSSPSHQGPSDPVASAIAVIPADGFDRLPSQSSLPLAAEDVGQRGTT